LQSAASGVLSFTQREIIDQLAVQQRLFHIHQIRNSMPRCAVCGDEIEYPHYYELEDTTTGHRIPWHRVEIKRD